MDNVYRIFQKGEEPTSGKVVTTIPLIAIITSPANGATLAGGIGVIRGAAYAGEADITDVELSVDNGVTWRAAEFIGPHKRYAWRRWEYAWQTSKPGVYTILARATDDREQIQPMTASWNALGYGNNGSRQHAITIIIQERIWDGNLN